MRNITPIVTPASVKKLFSFWTRSVWNARRTASISCMLSAAQARRELLAAIVALHHAVAEHYHPARVRGDVGFVRHHDHGLPRVREQLEDLHDLVRRGRVQVSRRLVREQDRGAVHE